MAAWLAVLALLLNLLAPLVMLKGAQAGTITDILALDGATICSAHAEAPVQPQSPAVPRDCPLCPLCWSVCHAPSALPVGDGAALPLPAVPVAARHALPAAEAPPLRPFAGPHSPRAPPAV